MAGPEPSTWPLLLARCGAGSSLMGPTPCQRRWYWRPRSGFLVTAMTYSRYVFFKVQCYHLFLGRIFKTSSLQVGVEGTGFEPTIEALFGENGFFPDSMSKVLYWIKDQTGLLSKILQRISPDMQTFEKQVNFSFQQSSTIPTYWVHLHLVSFPVLDIKCCAGSTWSFGRHQSWSPSTGGGDAFVSNSRGYCILTPSRSWDWLHENQWHQQSSRDPVHVLPHVLQDPAIPGQLSNQDHTKNFWLNSLVVFLTALQLSDEAVLLECHWVSPETIKPHALIL